MNAEKLFTSMYFDIWQSNNIDRIDQYYAKDFSEIITTSNQKGKPIELKLDYDGIIKQAKFQKDNYVDTTFKLKKLVSNNQYVSVQFYSNSILKQTGELRHRCVCGIWQLNEDNKISRVWAVVTPYYK